MQTFANLVDLRENSMLQNEHLLGTIGFDTAENEPSAICYTLATFASNFAIFWQGSPILSVLRLRRLGEGLQALEGRAHGGRVRGRLHLPGEELGLGSK